LEVVVGLEVVRALAAVRVVIEQAQVFQFHQGLLIQLQLALVALVPLVLQKVQTDHLLLFQL
jgi:maltodextrin utilization protein YvdJ